VALCAAKNNKEFRLGGALRNTLVLLFLCSSAHGQAIPFEALIISESGDYVGGGNTFHFVNNASDVYQPPPDGTGVHIRWTPNGFWQFGFTGPNGAPLHVGGYENAQRLPFQDAGAPGLDISGQGNGCNRLSGRFDVWDVAYAPDGSVTRLAVDAIQYCESANRALRLYLRYGDTTVPLKLPRTTSNAGADQTVLPAATVTLNGSQSTTQEGGALTYSWTQIGGTPVTLSGAQDVSATFVAPTPTAEWQVLLWQLEVQDAQGRRAVDTVTTIVSEISTPRSEIRVVSQQFEPVGQGQVIQQVVDPALLRINRNFHNGITLQYPFVAGPEFRLDLAGPNGQELAFGHYPIAYRYPFSSPSGMAGLNATLVLGCSQSFSDFDVHDVAYDSSGAIERLAVDFEQYCVDDATTLPFRGYVRINSPIPITSRAPTASAGPDLKVEPQDVVPLDGSMSTGGATPIATYSWAQLSGPTVQLLGASTKSPQFRAPAVPPTGATLEFQITVTNAGGYSSTDIARVNVRGSAEPRSIAYLEPTGFDFATYGQTLWFDDNFGTFHITDTNYSDRDHITVEFNDITFSTFDLESAEGTTIVPGVYPYTDTHRDELPGVSFSSDGRGCNQAVGHATVHEIERDANGHVIRLAYDFMYQCDYDSPVYGILRFNSTVPILAPTLRTSAGALQEAIGGDVVRLSAELTHPGAGTITGYSWRQVSGPPVSLSDSSNVIANFAVPDAGGVLEFEVTVTTSDGQTGSSIVRVNAQSAGTRRSRLVLDSDPGEPVTLGESLHMDMQDSPPQLRTATANHIEASVYSPHNFSLSIWAPFEEALVEGRVYEGTRIFGLARESVNFPGLAFGIDSLNCRSPRGRFVVRELVRNASGVPTSLAIDFQQACDPSNNFVRGALRFNSAVPVRSDTPLASAGPDLSARSGTNFSLDGRASTGWLPGNTTYRWQQIAGPAVTFSGASPNSSSSKFAVAMAPAVVSGTQDAVFQITVTNAAGLTATDSVTVKLLGESEPVNELIGSRYDPATQRSTQDWILDANNSYATVSSSSQEMNVRFANDYTVYAGFHLDSPTTKFSPGLYKVGPSDFQFDFGRANDAYCGGTTGVLRILSIRYEGDVLRSIAFDFDTHRCGTYAGYAAAVRWNSAERIEFGRARPEAGADTTVNEGVSVTLDGSKSMIIAAPVERYTWKQTAGPAVTLTELSPGIASFVAPEVSATSALQFSLEISGRAGLSVGSDGVEVKVNNITPPPPSPPVSGGGSSSSSGSGSGGGGGAFDPFTALALLVSLAAVLAARQRQPHLPTRNFR
jgi:hypothetical protein